MCTALLAYCTKSALAWTGFHTRQAVGHITAHCKQRVSAGHNAQLPQRGLASAGAAHGRKC
uniref:Uncharacterized protein n=1 Tax=Anguilla anguilla TaxID=7936 RepID=A0A0E9Q0N9_ANGAN